jgi:hypothetical protein
MIEVEGMINNRTISILIDSGAIHSYIDPKMVESLHFPRRKHGKYWLVQLATRAKRKVNEMVKSCLMDMNGGHEWAEHKGRFEHLSFRFL